VPTVVPSQIVRFIDASLGVFIAGQQSTALHPSVCGALNALIRLIEELPNSLLPCEPEAYSHLIRSMESIRFAVERAGSQESRSYATSGPPQLQPDGGGQPSQVSIIRDVLAGCPDEMPPRHSSDLSFVKDPAIRDALLLDLEATRLALLNSEWKAATVFGGSLVEALLLWAVEKQAPADIQAAGSAAVTRQALPKRPPSNPLDWVLNEYVEVAIDLALIEAATGAQVRLAKDFRNLIHPGRAIKKQEACDRGTALAASAAVELVSRDLQRRFP
jgi:hypothetical protein